MKPLNKQTASVLDTLTLGLVEPGADGASSRRVDNMPGTFMRVCVERIGASQYSVAHYYEQNGDLVQDPDMVFYKGPDGAWYPVSCQQAVGLYTVALEFEGETISGVRPTAYRDLSSFAAMWMRNIKQQQYGKALAS